METNWLNLVRADDVLKFVGTSKAPIRITWKVQRILLNYVVVWAGMCDLTGPEIRCFVHVFDKSLRFVVGKWPFSLKAISSVVLSCSYIPCIFLLLSQYKPAGSQLRLYKLKALPLQGVRIYEIIRVNLLVFYQNRRGISQGCCQAIK